jgi:hypothetical protein
MKGKANIGKVLLSVVIAMAMVVTAIPTIATEDGTNDNNTSNEPVLCTWVEEDITPQPVGYVAPDADVIFSEDFALGFGAFTVYNLSGDGNFTYNATGECVDYDPGYAATYPYGVENDYLNATFTIDVDCYDTVMLQFDYWGNGQDFDVLIDSTVVGTFTAGTFATADVDITSYIVPGTTQTLAFHVSGAPDRTFSIDNVQISVNYTTDIIINGIENMTDGGRYNTFPKTIEVNVTNRGTQPISDVDFHLQIYKEQPYEPENYKCWDLESCFLITWDTWSADGDQATWYWTEKRSHSPTHSYACKPDYLDTYEANSEDYLILHDWFTIPTTVDGKTVYSATLNFSYWAEGEYTDYTVTDYGMVFIELATNPGYANLIPIGGPYYETNGEWVYEEIDLSAYIGQDIKIWFGWFSDDYLNYEGMYVDDICIQLGYTSAQPLVFQGYKYADFGPNETKIIKFPLDFTPDEGTYFIQVYTDCDDCLLAGNEINWTIWFGDVCDAAILDVTAPAEVEMPDVGYAVIPIEVTVYNNGTLAEDVPVKVSANHILREELWSDDFEDGNRDEWTDAFTGIDTTGPTFIFHATDEDANTGLYSGYFGTNNHYLAGMNQAALTPEITIPPEYNHIWFEYAAKYAFYDPYWGGYYTFSPLGWYYGIPIYYAGPIYGQDVWMPILEDPVMNAFLGWWPSTVEGWMITGDNGPAFQNKLTPGAPDNPFESGESPNMYQVDITPWLEHYQAYGYVQDVFCMGFFLSTGTDGTALPWAGLMVDDVSIWYDMTGAEVWSDTQTVHLEPGESAVLTFYWNTTEYCDYVITAKVMLDCDQDPTNNEGTTNIRIYEQIYEDNYDEVAYEDNTYGLPDDWHIVEECSVCPQNHFWWNGREELNGYENGRDDSLYINATYDWSTASQVWINFTTRYDIEGQPFDWGALEVSNDSGVTWYVMNISEGYSGGWVSVAVNITPGVNVPATFFTDQMHVRFRFISDEGWNFKGWYIDNVSIEVDGVQVFYDDMEDAAVSADLWYHMATPAGCHWHVEDTFGNGPTAEWFWNGENRTWHPQYGKYYPKVDEKVILTFDLTHAYEATLTFEHNYSFADGDYGLVEISTDGGATWAAIKKFTGNSSGNWVGAGYDITKWVGGDVPVKIRFRVVADDSVEDYGWLVDNVSINGKVDYVNPTVTATLDPADPDGNFGWYKSPVTITLSAEDNVKVAAIYYRIDGGPWKTYTAPFTIDVDGEHTVDFYAVDEVGNPSDIGTVSFKIDHTAPTVSITFPTAGYIYLFGKELFKNPLGGTVIIGGITFQASASDATSGIDYVTFAIDGMTYEKATSPYEIFWHKFDLLPAKYTLTVSAYDIAGNKASDATLDFTHWL